MADKGGIQLLPENRKRIDIKVPGENRLVYAGAALLVLVLVVYSGLFVYSNSLSNKINDANAKLATLEKQRDKKAEANLVSLSKQIDLTSQIIKNHIYWSVGLSKIESALQNNVQFKVLSSNLNEGSLHFQALSDNYTSIAKQLAAFVADDSITDLSLDNVITLTNGKLNFSATIKFDKTKFLTIQ